MLLSLSWCDCHVLWVLFLQLHVHLGPHGHFEIERSVPDTALHLRANTVNHKDTRKYKFDPIGREWVQVQVDGDTSVLACSEPLLNFMLKSLLKNVRESGASATGNLK
jgi:hypothetical protein